MSVPSRELGEWYVDEVVSARLYRFLAAATGRRVFEELALMEEKHAGIIAGLMIGRGLKPPRRLPLRARLRERLLRLASRLLGYRILMLVMEHGELEAVVGYWRLLNDPSMVDARERVLELLRDEVVHEAGLYGEIHGFRVEAEGLKDAVYGMIDALVEIEAGLIGVAAATQPIIAGIAGLISSIAGSISMSVGAYLSTKSENEAASSEELADSVLSTVDKTRFLEKAWRRLREAGLTSEEASAIVELASGSQALLKLLSLHGEKASSPVKAARNAGLFYVLGAIGPVAPFLANLPLYHSVMLSLLLTLLVLLALSVFISLVSGARVLRVFAEYALLTLAATAATFTVGLAARRLLGLEV